MAPPLSPVVYILVALLRLFPSSVATTSIFSPAASPTPHLIIVSTSSLLPTTTTTKGTTFRNSPSTPLTSSLLLSSTASPLAPPPPPPPPPIPGVGHSQLRSSSSTFASTEVASFDVFFSSSSSYASTLSHAPTVVVSRPTTTAPFPSPPPLPSPPSPTVFPSRVLLPTSAPPPAASSLSFDVQIESSTVLLSTTTSIFSFVPTPTPLPSVIPYEYLVLHLTVSYEQFNRRLFLDEAAVFFVGAQSLIVRDNPYYKNESIVYVNNSPKGTRNLIDKFTRMTWRETFKNSSNQISGYRVGVPACIRLSLAVDFSQFDAEQFKDDLTTNYFTSTLPSTFKIENNPQNATEVRVYIEGNIDNTVTLIVGFQYMWRNGMFSNRTRRSILGYDVKAPVFIPTGQPPRPSTPAPTTEMTSTVFVEIPSSRIVLHLNIPAVNFNFSLFESGLKTYFASTFPPGFHIGADPNEPLDVLIYIAGDEAKNDEFISSFRTLWEDEKRRETIFDPAVLKSIDDYEVIEGDKEVLPQWAIAVIVVFCFIFIILILLIVFIARARSRPKRRRRRGKEGWPSTSNSFYTPPSRGGGTTAQANGRTQRRNISGVRLQVKSRTLDVAGLSTALENEEDLLEEFQSIPALMASESDVPRDCESKNRYMNVLPTPSSRVPLFLRFGEPGSDYINANFVRGFGDNSKAYIATQGPMESTINDFWRMIWEQNCSVIMMATGLVERDVPKCARYWPDETRIVETYGDIQVTIQQQAQKEDYMTTRFLIVHTDKQQSRTVLHHWFTAWPDFGVPEDVSQVIHYLEEIREDLKASKGPIVVHCSAGIGRSGCLMAVHVGMQDLEKSGRCDVLQTVSKLRLDRGGAVQTKDQYVLIYMALYTYATYLQSLMNMAKSDQTSFSNMRPGNMVETNIDVLEAEGVNRGLNRKLSQMSKEAIKERDEALLRGNLRATSPSSESQKGADAPNSLVPNMS